MYWPSALGQGLADVGTSALVVQTNKGGGWNDEKDLRKIEKVIVKRQFLSEKRKKQNKRLKNKVILVIGVLSQNILSVESKLRKTKRVLLSQWLKYSRSIDWKCCCYCLHHIVHIYHNTLSQNLSNKICCPVNRLKNMSTTLLAER